MLRDIRKNKTFNRRALVIGAVQSALTGALVLRLGYLQLWKKKEYSALSDSNRIKSVINPAPRGSIVDRHGMLLTKNDSSYRLLLYLDKKKNAQDVVESLDKLLKLTKRQKATFISKIKNARRKSVISLMDNLGWDDLARIEAKSHLMPGVSIESGIIRRYPYPRETAHLLGYVSLPSEKDIDENEQGLFMHPDFRIGKTGLEKTFDDSLRGKYGIKHVEVNVHETPIRTISVNPPLEGSKLNLTIDIALQKYVAQRIKDEVASVVVMDVKTGEILSSVSSPSFNPNNFVEGISEQYWQEISSDLRKPMNNKPISAMYPPGSTFKLMVALAALEEGINPKEKIKCNGYYKLGKRVSHCWKEGGHGRLDMSEAIKHSCNIYFFTISQQFGYEKFMEMSRRFGYGDQIDINLQGAKSGNIPSDAWKRKVHKNRWVGGDTLNAAIGQGFVLATPMQMALATARIANGGIPIKPHLVKNNEIAAQYDNLKSNPVVDAKHLQLVQEGMTRVMNEYGGTAYGKRIRVKGFEMAGKTGTSQVVSKREKDRSGMRNRANHAIFVGYAPAHDPKYAISVVVEHGGSGSRAAAPIGKDVMMELQGLNKRA